MERGEKQKGVYEKKEKIDSDHPRRKIKCADGEEPESPNADRRLMCLVHMLRREGRDGSWGELAVSQGGL